MIKTTTVSLEARQQLLKLFPCFHTLTPTQCADLANCLHEIHFTQHEKIVSENDIVDSIFIIVHGEAEVTRLSKHRHKIKSVPVATLSAGESIGLNDTGFFSKTGKRTATVTAVTDMCLLRLAVDDLVAFLDKYQLADAMHAASLKMLRMRFIKQSLPFAKLSHKRLRWLANRVEEMFLPAGEILFKQNEQGDKCYLIHEGKITITMLDKNGKDRTIATLAPPALFGEATLLTRGPRNATAIAASDCYLLVLRHDYLSELLESEKNIAAMFMTLMIDRSMPKQNPHVSMHQRISADGQEVTILKNEDNRSYFKLSREGLYIWERLDGDHTLQDITLELAEKYNLFAPDLIAGLISKLAKSKYVINVAVDDYLTQQTYPSWVRLILFLRQLFEKRIALGNVDQFLARIHKKYVRYFFAKRGQIILGFFAVLGTVLFALNTPEVLKFFSVRHANLLLLFAIIPFAIVKTILHELGHAFAVKACGREVNYIGVGWQWFMPIAFTDTSDMWLATRKARMLVNAAGIYVDIIVAALLAISMSFIANPYIQSLLWLFALYTYLGVFHMLNPLQESDGYYILMDWLEKNNLRRTAVIWLVRTLPKSLRKPGLIRKHRAEVQYWLTGLCYLVLLCLVTFILQHFLLGVLGIHVANPYLSLIIPFLVVIFSCFGILADIRNQAED